MNKSTFWSVLILVILAAGAFWAYRSAQSPEDALVPAPDSSTLSGGCFVGGCSGQICSDQEGAVSTCEYKEEYACYKSAKCERQASGQCGWTEPLEFSMCVNAIVNPGSNLK